MDAIGSTAGHLNLEKSKQKKMGMIELWRFLFMLLIMGRHLYHLGMKGDYPFRGAWIYVEFFFILTGGFTFKHFEKMRMQGKCPADYVHESIGYTLHKFKGFVGYAVIAVFSEYFIAGYSLLKSGQFSEFILSFRNMPFEMMFLSSSGIVNPKVAPIWYLSAMLLVMPLFCFVVQKYRSFFVSIGCWLFPVLYYGRVGVTSLRDWPHDMLRAFACMSLGAFAYLLSLEIQKINWNRRKRLLLTVIEFGSLLMTVFFTSRNWKVNEQMLLLFVIGSVSLFSGCSYTALLTGKIFDFLGKITLPMFLLHWTVGTVVRKLFISMEWRVCFYYGATIVLSAALYMMFRQIRKRRISFGPQDN